MMYEVFFKGIYVGKIFANAVEVREVEASGFILKTA